MTYKNLVLLGFVASVATAAAASQPPGNGPWDPNTAAMEYNYGKGAKTDCGAAKYAAVLIRTHALVKQEAEMPGFNSELVNMGGPVCDRIVFSIDGDGKATNISFGELPHDRALYKSALQALKGYLFYPPNKGEKNQFMIIFHSYSP